MRLFVVILLPFLAALPLGAQGYRLDISNVSGAKIYFQGSNNTFWFDPIGENAIDFQVTTSGGSYLNTLQGSIEGLFSIGEINTQVPGFLECAPVTLQSHSAAFKIYDGAGGIFSADLDWKKICAFYPGGGTSGSLTTEAEMNLTLLTFTPDSGGASNEFTSRLQALANSGAGNIVVSFQFGGNHLLSVLTANDFADGTSYSGTAIFDEVGANIPEPSTYATALALAGLVSTAWMRRRRVA